MIAIGFCILIIGIIGSVFALQDKHTTGWGATRLKFVLGCFMCIVAGVVIVFASLFEVDHYHFRYFQYLIMNRTFVTSAFG